MKRLLFVLLSCIGLSVSAQDVAVKSNLLYDAALNINGGVEFGVAPKWTVDVTGDGSASCGTVTATIVTSDKGTLTLSQPDLVTHDLHPIENNSLESGVPTYITASPVEGYQVRYYEINGNRINGNIFVATEDVTVSATFSPIAANNYIAMEVESNTPLSFGISGIDPETEVEIDWGNGEWQTMTIDNVSIKRIDGNSKGTTVRINGLIDYFDCAENELISLDVTHNVTLATLDCYWTGITSLDLSKNTELGKLDCSYNSLGSLDLSNNPKLFSLSCYNCELTSLDLSANTELEEAIVRNNSLAIFVFPVLAASSFIISVLNIFISNYLTQVILILKFIFSMIYFLSLQLFFHI